MVSKIKKISRKLVQKNLGTAMSEYLKKGRSFYKGLLNGFKSNIGKIGAIASLLNLLLGILHIMGVI